MTTTVLASVYGFSYLLFSDLCKVETRVEEEGTTTGYDFMYQPQVQSFLDMCLIKKDGDLSVSYGIDGTVDAYEKLAEASDAFLIASEAIKTPSEDNTATQ